MNISTEFGKHVLLPEGLDARIKEAASSLFAQKMDFTGWTDLPEKWLKGEAFAEIQKTADEIRKKAKLLIVIGIGGSYLGAKAVIEALAPEKMLGHPAADGRDTQIAFAGCNLSSAYHKVLLNAVKTMDTEICVISKSGTTTEPALAFALFKEALIKKYGRAEAMKRIVAITDEKKGTLREEADREGYKTFIVPDDVGGRYSVLTPVGLLPIAAAGIDIRRLLKGALEMKESIQSKPGTSGPLAYAGARYRLSTEKGGTGVWPKTTEIFEYYEPRLAYFAEWLKQLFGESEGKEGLGIFPASLSFSADLHSMGQFLQEGRQIFFETVLDVREPGTDLLAPMGAGPLLEGRSMNQVERAATDGVIRAHEAAGVPVIRVSLPDFSPNVMGQMIYFFEMNCAVTALLSGVNPFDQPGVEAYKAEMKAGLAYKR